MMPVAPWKIQSIPALECIPNSTWGAVSKSAWADKLEDRLQINLLRRISGVSPCAALRMSYAGSFLDIGQVRRDGECHASCQFEFSFQGHLIAIEFAVPNR